MPVLRFLSLVMAAMFVFGGLSTSPLAKPNWPKTPTGKPVLATPTMKTRQIPKPLAIGSLVALRGSPALANSTQTSNQLWESKSSNSIGTPVRSAVMGSGSSFVIEYITALS